jgi:endonuclease-3
MSAAVPRASWRRPPARRVRALRARLREVYGIPVMAPHGDPLGELVLTVLSQSTNDRNRDVAFLRLRQRFPTWAAVSDAPVEEIEEAIQPGGLHVQKSRRIKEILAALPENLDLSWLRDVPVAEARAYLTALPGVGRKTAACVLLFAYSLRDVPVDTHVGRVATRLALLRPGAGSEEQHDELTALSPPGAELEFHVNLLRHGRRTCHAQRPACLHCALRRMCPSRQA